MAEVAEVAKVAKEAKEAEEATPPPPPRCPAAPTPPRPAPPRPVAIPGSDRRPRPSRRQLATASPAAPRRERGGGGSLGVGRGGGGSRRRNAAAARASENVQARRASSPCLGSGGIGAGLAHESTRRRARLLMVDAASRERRSPTTSPPRSSRATANAQQPRRVEVINESKQRKWRGDRRPRYRAQLARNDVPEGRVRPEDEELQSHQSKLVLATAFDEGAENGCQEAAGRRWRGGEAVGRRGRRGGGGRGGGAVCLVVVLGVVVE